MSQELTFCNSLIFISVNSAVEDNDIDYSEQILITDSIASIARLKDKSTVIFLLSLSKIEKDRKLFQSINRLDMKDYKLSGSILEFINVTDTKMTWSGEYKETITVAL